MIKYFLYHIVRDFRYILRAIEIYRENKITKQQPQFLSLIHLRSIVNSIIACGTVAVTIVRGSGLRMRQTHKYIV
jgi:hypothetical protein